MKYRNGKTARILCTDRPNTQFVILSMDEDGTLYHHLADGSNNIGQVESQWDIMP